MELSKAHHRYIKGSIEIPNGDRSTLGCFSCRAPVSLTRPQIHCPGCLLVAYCSVDCASADWFLHKPVCDEFPALNGINVLHTTRPWIKHITGLRKRAARLPFASEVAIPIFSHPKVCHTCQEARPDLLTVCKCAYVCYCSEICSHTDKLHQINCENLKSLTETFSLNYMRGSYPASLLSALFQIDKLGPDHRHKNDLITLNIHVITNTAYFDAITWKSLFHYFPNLEQMNLAFVIQGMAYNQSFDKCERLTVLGCGCECQDCESHNRVITYSVHQKPYHMYFSSLEYTEPDVVVAYGIPYVNDDIHSEISYRNMTYCKHTVLVLMDSTKELVTQGAQAVCTTQPLNVLVPLQENSQKWFGANRSELDFDESAPNVKYYFTCLCRDELIKLNLTECFAFFHILLLEGGINNKFLDPPSKNM